MGGSRARLSAGEDVQDLPGGEGVAAHPDRQEGQNRRQQDGRPQDELFPPLLSHRSIPPLCGIWPFLIW